MLNCSNIHYGVGKTSILTDVCMTVERGEMVALCGPNGAGKSTLLKIASGEMQPNKGSVTLLDTPLNEWKPGVLAQARAKLSQESHLTFSFRAREVVEMGRFPHDTARANGDIVDACMDTVGVRDLENRDYTTLSGGEKQRVHMARVLAQLTDTEKSPKLLLLDEPTSALDLHHQEVVLDLAHKLCRERDYGVLVVLHDLNLAAAWADRVVLLKNGTVYETGQPESVLTDEVLRSVYDVEAMVIPHPVTGRPVVTIDRKNPSQS